MARKKRRRMNRRKFLGMQKTWVLEETTPVVEMPFNERLMEMISARSMEAYRYKPLTNMILAQVDSERGS